MQTEQSIMFAALAQMAALAGVPMPSIGKRSPEPTRSDVEALIAAKQKRDRRAARNLKNWRAAQVDIQELCNACEDPTGYFCRGTIKPKRFVAEVGKFLQDLGAGPVELNVDDVRHVRWKYYQEPGSAEDENWSMVPAQPGDPDGFEATYIHYE